MKPAHHLALALALAITPASLAAIGTTPSPAAAATAGTPLPDHAVGVTIYHTQAAYAEYEAWLGRQVDIGMFYFHGDTPSAVIQQANSVMKSFKTSKWNTMIYSLPLSFPGQTLEQVANGANDAFLRDLGAAMVAQGRGDDVVRPGWEFNGAWFRWSGVGRWDTYAAAFRRTVTAMRSAPGAQNLKFEWNFGRAGYAVPDEAYPGDAYVDVIGMDLYDSLYGPRLTEPAARWEELLNGRAGLKFARDFAARHGKPMGISEWGVSDEHGPGSDPDNPYFIEQMYNWIRSNNYAYSVYFERDSNHDHRLMLPHFPRSSAKYRELFSRGLGGGGTTPTTTTTTTMPSSTTTTRPASTTTTTGPGSTTTTTMPVTTTTRPVSGGGSTDEFTGAALAAGWTVTNPSGRGSVTVGGGAVSLAVPSGRSHNLWATDRDGLRITRSATDGDQTITADFANSPTRRIQNQGVIVEGTDGSTLRFDLIYTNDGLQAFVGLVTSGSSVELRRVNLSSSGALSISVRRSGSEWTMSVGRAGATAPVATVVQPMSVARVGVWAGNAGQDPAHTARLDRFTIS